jgi:Tfp pilus assembly PilM family ATPase
VSHDTVGPGPPRDESPPPTPRRPAGPVRSVRAGGRSSEAPPVRARLFRPLDPIGRGVAAGIEIGATAVRAALVRRRGSASEVIATLEIPYSGSHGREAALEDAARRLGLAARDVAVVLGGSEIEADLVALDDVPGRERPDAIRWKLRKRGPTHGGATDVVSHRFERHAGAEPGVESAALFLGIAAAESVLAELGGALEAAGVRRHRFSPDVCAVETLLQRAGETQADDPVAVVHLGDGASTLYVHSSRGFESRQSLRFALADLERSLTEPISLESGVLHLSEDQAAAALRRLDLGGERSVSLAGRGDVPSGALLALVRPHLERLEGDVEKCLRLFDRASGLPPCERLRVAGPGAELIGIAGRLAARLGMQAEVLEPVPSARTEGGPSLARFALAVGAALDRAGALDLVPPAVRRSRALEVASFTARRAAVLFAIFAGALAALRGLDAKRTRGEIAQARARLAELGPAVERVHAFERVSARAMRTESLLRSTAPREWSVAGTIGDLARAMPASVRLDEIVLAASDASPKLSARGRLSAPSIEQADTDADDLVLALQASPFFRDVETSIPERSVSAEAPADVQIHATPSLLPRRY